MNDISILQRNRDIFEKHGAKFAGLFGSRARGDNREDSDYDILVDIEKPIGLFAFTGFELELAARLGKKVDLVTERSVSPYIKDRVIRDLKVFYGKR